MTAMVLLALLALLGAHVIYRRFRCKYDVIKAFGSGMQVGRSLARFSDVQVDMLLDGTGLSRKDTDG